MAKYFNLEEETKIITNITVKNISIVNNYY